VKRSVSLPVSHPAPLRVPTHRRRSPGEWLDDHFQYWAILPAVLILLVLTVFPVIELAGMSFSTVAFAEGKINWTYTGLDNFNTFLKDEIFMTAVRNTVIFVAVTVTSELILGLMLALVVSQITKNSGLSRAVIMIPILVPAIAIGTIWRLMYNYEFGIFNFIITSLGLPQQNFTGSTNLALLSIIVVDIWHWTSFVFLLMLAGIESLPIEPMEAARVDGASDTQLLRYVVLPLLRPTILVTLLFRTIFAFKVFDEVFLLTGGGPGNATEVISLYINRVFFSQSRMGYGAFLSLVTILLIGVFVLIYNRVARKRSSSI
jgi:multiple sugar transport system permease protein